MSERRCLYCYEPLQNSETNYHPKCSQSFFGTKVPPLLNLEKKDLIDMARKLIVRSVAVTGVQPKLSLDLEQVDTRTSRLTVVGLWGNYILKPPTEQFLNLPQNEDLTMKLARLCGINTAAHCLVRLQSGELAYLTKRFDRQGENKIHVEDMCQLTETLTEHKYRGSIEKVGKVVRAYTTNQGLEVIKLFEIVMFCFITGNADMHLKNFSLIRFDEGDVVLSPAYDLLSTTLVIPEDLEESALTINGKKNRLRKTDFEMLAKSLSIPQKSTERIISKMLGKKDAMIELIKRSFLAEDEKEKYINLLIMRLMKLV